MIIVIVSTFIFEKTINVEHKYFVNAVPFFSLSRQVCGCVCYLLKNKKETQIHLLLSNERLYILAPYISRIANCFFPSFLKIAMLRNGS